MWQTIERWKSTYGARTRHGVLDEQLTEAERAIGTLPSTLRELLRITNGLSLNSFKLFPVFDTTDAKNTWESLQRMNDPVATRYLGKDPTLLKRFLIFSDIGGGDCAVIDRSDGSIWYEDKGELNQTDFDVVGFIEASLREQAE